MAFMKTLYLDKRELAKTHWQPLTIGFAIAIVLGSIPVWRESVDERFVLRPAQLAELRAIEPGMVTEVRVTEGQKVAAGDTIAVLRELDLDSQSARVAADYRQANARFVQAGLKYASVGPAEQDRLRLQQDWQVISERQARLKIVSPIAGTVTTARMADLAGSYLKPGDLVAQVASTQQLLAEIYVPEADVQKLQQIQQTTLRMDAIWKPMNVQFESLSLVSQPLQSGLMPPSKYKGMHEPVYYVLRMRVPNERQVLHVGMTGTARVYGQKRSALGLFFRPAVEAVARRLW
jgi:multidrug efflux pump subunit AcrA (membrane-fusion protein)